MPDPHLLYVVSGVVVLGLVIWVVVVLAIAPPITEAPHPAPVPAPDEKEPPHEEPEKDHGLKAATREPGKVTPAPESADKPRMWLQSYGEIHDEPAATGSAEPHGDPAAGEKNDPT